MAAVWAFMGPRYGQAWTKTNGVEPTNPKTGGLTAPAKLWLGDLMAAKVSWGKMLHGLDRCRSLPGNFPPALPGFVALCLDSDLPKDARVARPNGTSPPPDAARDAEYASAAGLLPGPTVRRKPAEWLAEIRSVLQNQP